MQETIDSVVQAFLQKNIYDFSSDFHRKDTHLNIQLRGEHGSSTEPVRNETGLMTYFSINSAGRIIGIHPKHPPVGCIKPCKSWDKLPFPHLASRISAHQSVDAVVFFRVPPQKMGQSIQTNTPIFSDMNHF